MDEIIPSTEIQTQIYDRLIPNSVLVFDLTYMCTVYCRPALSYHSFLLSIFFQIVENRHVIVIF